MGLPDRAPAGAGDRSSRAQRHERDVAPGVHAGRRLRPAMRRLLASSGASARRACLAARLRRTRTPSPCERERALLDERYIFLLIHPRTCQLECGQRNRRDPRDRRSRRSRAAGMRLGPGEKSPRSGFVVLQVLDGGGRVSQPARRAVLRVATCLDKPCVSSRHILVVAGARAVAGRSGGDAHGVKRSRVRADARCRPGARKARLRRRTAPVRRAPAFPRGLS
jgi:hypothetical protein